ncbi:MAG: choice-of-anchor tandem repeat GloVer-containing protein [Candidatus Sulfotelmatobacter sp.]
MKKLSRLEVICAVLAFCAATTTALPAQTLKTLARFSGISTSTPEGSLVQAGNGNFYGTAPQTGSSSVGSVFEITPQGELVTLYSFCPQGGNCTDGDFPAAGLVQASNGNFYGTTTFGGADDGGTVFEITPAGTLTTLYSFCAEAHCTDGEFPFAGLVQAHDGNFYGTTSYAGAHHGGTVFEITPAGKLTTLYSFCAEANCADGSGPYAPLLQARNGNFYGTTPYGGPSGLEGTVFEITPGGKLTTLYSFCKQTNCADGDYPNGLVQARDGNFYGTTSGNVAAGPWGTVFEITPKGELTTIYTFCSQTNCTDGANPVAGLIQASDGNFYGTSSEGGASGYGTAFEISAVGKLTTLYSFCVRADCGDGMNPFAGLMQATNGNFYGTTSGYGNPNCFSDCPSVATIFGLSVGLGPFVETRPASGKTGTKVVILGNNLSQATAVSFNGVEAMFEVVSDTEIAAVVPAGATSGVVKVTTPDAELKSNVAFQVVE